MAPASTPAEAATRSRLKKLIITIVIISIAVHLVAGLIAGFWIVARYFSNPPAEFKVVKDIRLPAQEREHSMNMAAFDSMAPKPSFNDKMQSLRPTAFALPELPKVPMDQMLPLDPSAIVSDQVSSLAGASGLGNGGGTGSGGGGGNGLGKGFSFFGVQTTGKNILLLFDVSDSVVHKAEASGVPLSKIKEETLNLLKQLPITARFGIIQFTQNYKPFQKQLVPATDQNRAAAEKWVAEEWVETGTMHASGKVVSNPRGIVGVLELAVQMQPDVIFLISDASFQWKQGGSSISDVPWPEVAKLVDTGLQGAGGACKVNFIGFQMKPEDRREIGTIARKTGGQVREMK